MKKLIVPILTVLFLSMIGFTSCLKKKFDTPPDTTTLDPNLPVNSSIWELKQRYTGAPTLIEDDITIAGIVVADDRSGNFYKQIVIQDTSSGIVVLLGKSSLYNEYPIGRKVYIKCKGLYVGAYGGFVQLGSTPDISNALSNIPTTMIGKYIFKGKYDINQVTARKVSINELNSLNASIKWLGTLIEIDSAEFVIADAGQPYAQDPNISSGTDRKIEDCAGANIVLRNSGYSNFRTALTPTGKGPIRAIFSRYNSYPQLLIRDTTDTKFTATRCGGVVILPPANITIDSLRKMYPDTSSTQTITLGNQIIHGTVISSYKDSNISQSSSFYMQDESGRGINVYGISGLALGDSITINLSGNQLIVYNGALEVKKGSGSLTATKISSGKTVTPVVLTVADFNADMNQLVFNKRKYESVLVKFVGVTISGTPAFYSGNKTVTDATGSVILYSRNAPPYSTTAIPVGAVNLTAIGIKYKTTPELYIRNLSDVQ